MNTENTKKRNIPRIALLMCLCLLIAGSGFTYSYARYRTETAVSGTVKYEARLAGAFTLTETQNGTMAGFEETAAGITATQITAPYTSVTRTPQITVTDKTDIPAYLYAEVTDDLNGEALSHMQDSWTALDGVTGAHNGQIFLYTPEGNADYKIADEDLTVHVFSPETFDYTDASENNITVYAYMIEAKEGATGADTFGAEGVITDTTSYVMYRCIPGIAGCAVNAANGTVANTGNVAGYIRAAVTVNELDDAGNIDISAGNRAILTVNEGWTKHGDYYYYNDLVAPDGFTLTGPVSVSNAGGHTQVRIFAEIVQADAGTDPMLAFE